MKTTKSEYSWSDIKSDTGSEGWVTVGESDVESWEHASDVTVSPSNTSIVDDCRLINTPPLHPSITDDIIGESCNDPPSSPSSPSFADLLRNLPPLPQCVTAGIFNILTSDNTVHVSPLCLYPNVDNDVFIEKDDFVSAKVSAITKRARKYIIDEAGEGRYNFGTGHTVWGKHSDLKASLRLSKTVHLPGDTSDDVSNQFSGITEFEMELGVDMNLKNVCLDKKRRWEIVPLLLSDIADITHAHTYGAQGMTDKDLLFNAEKSHRSIYVLTDPITYSEKKCEEIEMNGAVKDSFYFGMLARSKRKHFYRNLPAEARKIPKGLTERRLTITRMNPTSLNTRKKKKFGARVEDWHHNSYWSPAALNDDRDYLDIDMGKPCLVTAFGTKGRATQWNGSKGDYEETSPQPSHWVTSYRLFYKLQKDSQWTLVGEFAGNTDRDSEVAHNLADQSNLKKGVLCQFLRYQPREYHSYKAARVGVYGSYPVVADTASRAAERATEKKLNLALLPTNKNRANEPKTAKSSASKLEPFVNGDSPSVVFTISKVENNSNMKKHRYRLSCCSCYVCRYREPREKWIARHIKEEIENYTGDNDYMQYGDSI